MIKTGASRIEVGGLRQQNLMLMISLLINCSISNIQYRASSIQYPVPI